MRRWRADPASRRSIRCARTSRIAAGAPTSRRVRAHSSHPVPEGEPSRRSPGSASATSVSPSRAVRVLRDMLPGATPADPDARQGTRSSSGCTTMSTRAPLRHTVSSIRRPIACSTISRWMPVALVTGVPSTEITMSPRRAPAVAGRAARHDRGDLHPGARSDPGGQLRTQRDLSARDAEPRPPHPPTGHQRVDDLTRRRVDRHGQPETDAGDRRVDADHPPGAVGEHARRCCRG